MILLTGGAGYIGSHMAAALATVGMPYVLFDNFANSHPGVLHRLKQLGNGISPLLMGGESVIRGHSMPCLPATP